MFKCKQIEPDWEGHCDNCQAAPIIPATGLCGPCTFGEAETMNGEWESIVDEKCEDCDDNCEKVK